MVRKQDIDGFLGGADVGKKWIGLYGGRGGEEMVSCTCV